MVSTVIQITIFQYSVRNIGELWIFLQPTHCETCPKYDIKGKKSVRRIRILLNINNSSSNGCGETFYCVYNIFMLYLIIIFLHWNIDHFSRYVSYVGIIDLANWDSKYVKETAECKRIIWKADCYWRRHFRIDNVPADFLIHIWCIY